MVFFHDIFRKTYFLKCFVSFLFRNIEQGNEENVIETDMVQDDGFEGARATGKFCSFISVQFSKNFIFFNSQVLVLHHSKQLIQMMMTMMTMKMELGNRWKQLMIKSSFH